MLSCVFTAKWCEAAGTTSPAVFPLIVEDVESMKSCCCFVHIKLQPSGEERYSARHFGVIFVLPSDYGLLVLCHLIQLHIKIHIHLISVQELRFGLNMRMILQNRCFMQNLFAYIQ